jgi:hypothetical protein
MLKHESRRERRLIASTIGPRARFLPLEEGVGQNLPDPVSFPARRGQHLRHLGIILARKGNAVRIVPELVDNRLKDCIHNGGANANLTGGLFIASRQSRLRTY